MHSLVRRIDGSRVAHLVSHSGDKYVALVSVLQAHSADMCREMSLLNKVRNHCLGQARRLPVQEIACSDECFEQHGRHNGVPKSQAGKKRLVQGADIDHALALVEALERCELPPTITKFAGIVVLDNPRLRLAGPTQKLEAPRDREQNAGWELVGGRNEHGARFGGRPDARADVNSLSIDRNRMSFHPRGDKSLPCQRIAGVFYPRLYIGLAQDSNHKINRMLGTSGHDDLLGIAPNGAGSAQIIANRLAKLW